MAFVTGTHEVVEAVPDQGLVLRTHPFGMSNGPRWNWTFSPENGGTRLDLDRADEGPEVVKTISHLLEKTLDKTYTRWLNAIKTNVEDAASTPG